MSPQGRLAVLIAFTGDGGVEKMITNLLGGFVQAGIGVDLVLLKAQGRHLSQIPAGVRVIPLEVKTSLLALPALMRYLKAERPRAMLVAKDRASRVALLARRLSGVDTRIVLRMGMHLSGSLAGKSALRRWSRYLPVRWLYPWADQIIAVAQGVAEDLGAIGRIPVSRFTVIPNPTVTPELLRLAAEPVEHPWLATPRQAPVILGAGRLKEQKDFPTLLRAFALVRQTRDARLIILGDGPDHASLLELARELGVAEDVELPGFQPNPYAWMARADAFVLSSRYEGSPNVLIEALATGTPVVATDCPSGPREILQDGKVAPLVPMGDVEALATAMAGVLGAPPDREQMRQAVRSYRLDTSTARYLAALGYDV